jgi:hypothetical protein
MDQQQADRIEAQYAFILEMLGKILDGVALLLIEDVGPPPDDDGFPPDMTRQ